MGPTLTSAMKVWSFGAALSMLGLATGCTSRTFQVDAIKNPDVAASGLAFEIVNANPERDATDALVQESVEYVKTALSSKGMFEAPDNVPANFTVEVDFGGEAPRREEIRIEEPVYRTVREPGTYYSETYTDANGKTYTVTRYVPGATYTTFDGWRTRYITIVLYPKYLRISAREAPRGGDDRPPREVWSVYVTNEDEDEDLEKCLPLMVAAAMDAIDQNTSSERTVTLGEGDERVLFVKRGM